MTRQVPRKAGDVSVGSGVCAPGGAPGAGLAVGLCGPGWPQTLVGGCPRLDSAAFLQCQITCAATGGLSTVFPACRRKGGSTGKPRRRC